MGMIYKRGDIYWIKYYRDGKPYRESTRSRKEADAKRLLKKREGEISEGKLPGIYFDRVKFEDLAEDLLNDYRVNGNKTLAKTQERIELHLSPFFRGMRGTDITTSKVNEYVALRIEEGASNATINRELAALKRMLNLGVKQTPPKVDRLPYMPSLKERNTRKGFFEHREFLSLVDQLPEYLKGIVHFGYKTGWRTSEITGLTWEQVDLKRGVVRLEAGDTKNREARTIHVDAEILDVLKDQFRNRRLGCLYVFHNEGRRINRFDKAWKTACRKSGQEGRLFHDLRRTAVRNMVRAGVPERVAMQISGHKTRSVFERYNIVSGDDLSKAASSLETYLNSFQAQENVGGHTDGHNQRKRV